MRCKVVKGRGTRDEGRVNFARQSSSPLTPRLSPLPKGYSLLEVLIATTILALGLVAIFGLTHTAHQRSVDASDLAAVELACQTTLNELLAKQTPMEPIAPKSVDGARHWKLDVQFADAPRPGLAILLVSARKFDPQGELPTGNSFQLVRWVPKSRVKQIDTSPAPFSSEESPFAEFESPFE